MEEVELNLGRIGLIFCPTPFEKDSASFDDLESMHLLSTYLSVCIEYTCSTTVLQPTALLFACISPERTLSV